MGNSLIDGPFKGVISIKTVELEWEYVWALASDKNTDQTWV